MEADHRGILDFGENTLYDNIIICVITLFPKPLECTPPRMKLKINHDLWVIMTRHCRFINSNKDTTQVGGVDMGEAVHVWGRGCVGNLCPSFSSLL